MRSLRNKESIFIFSAVFIQGRQAKACILGWSVLIGGREIIEREDEKFLKTVLTGAILHWKSDVRQWASLGCGIRQPGKPNIAFQGKLVDGTTAYCMRWQARDLLQNNVNSVIQYRVDYFTHTYQPCVSAIKV